MAKQTILLSFSMTDLINVNNNTFFLNINLNQFKTNSRLRMYVKDFSIIRINPPADERMYFLCSDTLQFSDSINALMNMSTVLCKVHSQCLSIDNVLEDQATFYINNINGNHKFWIQDHLGVVLSTTEISNWFVSFVIIQG